MYKLALIFSVFIALHATAKSNYNNNNLNCVSAVNEKVAVENLLFADKKNSFQTIVDITDVNVIEIDEDVDLGYDTSEFLPENFNPLKGKHDLDWTNINLVELEEEVDLGFDSKRYLPRNFNAIKGKYDLDWTSIELVEIEEDANIDFDTEAYLPNNFNPHLLLQEEKASICLY